MAAPSERVEMAPEKIVFSLKSGASLVTTKPIISHDNKYVMVCSGTVIKVFSTVSGDCIRELKGHTSRVTGMVIHPTNKLQLMSCSLDESIIIWDYADGVSLKHEKLHAPLLGVYVGGPGTNWVYVLQQASGTGCELVKCSLGTSDRQKDKHDKVTTVLRNCSKDSRKTAVGTQGRYCVTVSEYKMRVTDSSRNDYVVSHYIDRDLEMTCVACHPSTMCIATGCSNGAIYIWYWILNKDKAVKTTLHWHSLAVRDLCYTQEGSYLLSGGHECVLVKWHQESKFRNFLPRLGAPINHVACSHDNQLITTCQDDNVVQMISSNFELQQVYQGLTRGYHGDKKGPLIPTGLVCDPRSDSLVLNGRPGHIQFYNVIEDKQLYSLDIVGQNYISPENINKPLHVTTVTNAAFDSKGDWLVTSEYWNDGIMSPEIRLKFWKFNQETQRYVLNTTAEGAHATEIVALQLRPSSLTSSDFEHMAVTSSVDGKFKVWTLVDDTDIYRANEKWACQCVGFYRDLPAGQVAFSQDGSLLAVVFSACVTLWEPDTNLLKGTLLCSNIKQDPVRHILFGNGACSQYLVGCTDSLMTVWSLVTCSVYWSVDLAIDCICKDPCSDVMAAFSADKDLFVFRPSSHTPVFSHDGVSQSPITSCVFIPHSKRDLYRDTTLSWQSQAQLYFMNNDQELLAVDMETESPKGNAVVAFEQNLPETALSIIMKEHTNRSGVKVNQGIVARQPEGKFKREILTSAAHVQPSVRVLCKPFIHSLLLPCSSDDSNLKTDIEDEEEDATFSQQILTGLQDSDVDSDMETDQSVSQSSKQKTAESSNVMDRVCKTFEKLDTDSSKKSKSSERVEKKGQQQDKKDMPLMKTDISETDLKFLKSGLPWYKTGVKL